MTGRFPRGADWWSDGVHYRAVYLPSGYSMIETIGMTPEKRAQLLDPIANMKVAGRVRRRRETRAAYLKRVLGR